MKKYVYSLCLLGMLSGCGKMELQISSTPSDAASSPKKEAAIQTRPVMSKYLAEATIIADTEKEVVVEYLFRDGASTTRYETKLAKVCLGNTLYLTNKENDVSVVFVPYYSKGALVVCG